MGSDSLAENRIATLMAYDCWKLLDKAEIARVAWQGPDGVAVVPVNYAVVAGALWFRTDPSSALARECHGQRVAVEVDEIDRDTRAGWSVVVAGVAELIDATEAPDMLMGMRIWPSGPRSVFVRVDAAEITGRKLWGLR
jgi:nitroimidazol reductase NimA-like FMN-containing flavoprotein (pyridoxamine 5'-phosphate oxidase superfamily)